MKISHYQIQSQEKQDFNILTVIFNPPTAFFFFFFFPGDLLASFEKEFSNRPCFSGHFSAPGMKSSYHIIKCQCTKKQREFFSRQEQSWLFCLRNSTHFFFHKPTNFNIVIQQSAFHTETKPHLL